MQLTLKNFQSHADTTLELLPGVNILIGHSDKGKSSIIRAVKWLTENKPSGEEFKSNFAPKKLTEVVWESEDNIVARGRDKDKNYYQLDDEEFLAFGQDVPKPIQEFFNLSDLNFQNQHDPPFLLSESPGSVARCINSVVNLESIDETIKNANAGLRKVDSELNHFNKQLKQLDAEIVLCPDFNTIDAIVSTLETYTKKVQSNIIFLNTIGVLITNITYYQSILSSIFFPNIDAVNNLSIMVDEYSIRNKNIGKIATLIEEIICKQKIIKEAYVPACDLDLSMYSYYTKYNNRIIKLNQLINTISQTNTNIKRLYGEIEKWENLLITKFPAVCPLCQRPMLKHKNKCIVNGVE